jgi:galactose mutarotase-like enzyme
MQLQGEVQELAIEEWLKEKYPFDFALELEYHLIDNEIKEVYRVINKDNVMMHFSIGGHPAFVTPENDASMAGCKIRFDADRITYHLIGDYQLMARDEYELPLINHEYTIQEDSFEKDAFIIEGGQAGTVSLVKNEKPFVTVKFDTPVFGLWSCKSKNVPFVCIEPWYGRTDAIDFTGELKDREYSNHIDAGEVFEKSFSIFFY